MSDMSSQPARKNSKPVKTNLVLALVLLLTSTFAYWYEFKKKHQIDQAASEKSKLLTLDQNTEIESLQVVAQDKGVDVQMRCKEHCRLSDPNGEWELTSPLSFKADESNIGTFITSIMATNVQETLPIEGDVEARLKEFGLGKDKRDGRKAVIKFKSDAQPYVIYFGDNTAVGENLYLYLSDPKAAKNSPEVVRIVPSYVRTNMERNLSYWRDKKVFNFAASEVEGLKLTNPAGSVELKRDGGNWYLEPGHRLADNEAVDTFVTGLVFMRAQEYVSDDKVKDRAKLKLPPKPHYHLTVKVAKRPDVNFEVDDVLIDKTPKLYAMLGDKSYVVDLDRTNADKFTKKADSFRLHNLVTPAEKEQIHKIQVRFSGKDSFTFEGEGANWKVTSGKFEVFEPSMVEQALVTIGAARIAEFMGTKPVPSGNEELSAWTFFDKKGEKLRTFTIYGTTAKGEYYVKLSSGELGKLERGSGSAIPTKVTELHASAEPKPKK